MGAAAEWHAFLDEFRALGGRAENVMQRKGKFGMGIFPIDPSKPVDLFVPNTLLVRTDNVELQDGNLAIKDNQKYSQQYSDWFKKYQDTYSWGAEGKKNIFDFEKGFKELPDDIKNLLKLYGLYNPERRFPEKEPDKEILERFIMTRCINYNKENVIMPIIDLINHSPSEKTYEINDAGISVSGTYDGEVLVRYNWNDPLRRLIGYGFNAIEPLGFSIRCRIQHKDLTVIVQGGQSDNPFKPCQISFKDGRLFIQQPLLGSLRTPKMPRTLFLQACKNVKEINADELFDQIHYFNKIALIKIIRESQEIESQAATLLRIGCLNQIEAQSNYYGLRDDLLKKELP